MVSETTSDVVHKALETVKTQTVNEWINNMKNSVQSKRVRVNHLINQEQK